MIFQLFGDRDSGGYTKVGRYDSYCGMWQQGNPWRWLQLLEQDLIQLQKGAKLSYFCLGEIMPFFQTVLVLHCSVSCIIVLFTVAGVYRYAWESVETFFRCLEEVQGSPRSSAFNLLWLQGSVLEEHKASSVSSGLEESYEARKASNEGHSRGG